MKKLILFSVAALALLAACQKQEPFGRPKEEAKPVATACYASSIDSTRILVAKGIANCMRSQSFSDGLAEGLAQMRDGDSEVLMAEIFLSPRTRGRAWNTEVASQLAKQLRIHGLKTRGEGQNAVIENLLLADPLMQVLYVPANDDYSREEVDLAANNLKVVVLPQDYDDQSSDLLLAYDRFGNEITYDPKDMESPLVVVGENERLEFVQGDGTNDDAATYLQTIHGRYISSLREPSRFFDPLEDPYNPPSPTPNPTPKPIKRGIRSTSENIVRARFTSTEAMREYEARLLGKPEVQYNAQMIGLTSGLSIGENWKKGYWVDFNTEVGYWTLLNTIAVDFYTVAWTEIDNSGKILMLELNSIIGGIPIKGSVALTRRDDPIGSQTIYYESEIDSEGYRTYTLGNTFQFTIRVKERG